MARLYGVCQAVPPIGQREGLVCQSCTISIVSRTNRYNQIKYVDDPTIMSWQIGNEPRAFSDENKEPFARWMADVAAQIKSLDPNHMVSSGSELVGMRNGYESFREDSCRPQHQLSEYPHLALQLELGEGRTA